ncbi:Hypothetical protein NTJ_06138 [Nesidiocoris tenuis]|uniref:Transmembrane protein n=1 Tax=Nesidiocoris tenuis TaxID=355587 RepID=A0ABN7APX2_9HEMI|nr:Hypothetical protein NTJ_06138 [Nesidiocoris tenuis]
MHNLKRKWRKYNATPGREWEAIARTRAPRGSQLSVGSPNCVGGFVCWGLAMVVASAYTVRQTDQYKRERESSRREEGPRIAGASTLLLRLTKPRFPSSGRSFPESLPRRADGNSIDDSFTIS